MQNRWTKLERDQMRISVCDSLEVLFQRWCTAGRNYNSDVAEKAGEQFREQFHALLAAWEKTLLQQDGNA